MKHCRRRGWFSRVSFRGTEDILGKLLARGDAVTLVLRYYRVKLWHRYNGFPRGKEDPQQQLDLMKKRLSSEPSFLAKHDGERSEVWCFDYRGYRFFVVAAPNCLTVRASSTVPGSKVVSFLHLLYFHLLPSFCRSV